MRFIVFGADASTGKDVQFAVNAANIAEAQAIARQRNVFVESVAPEATALVRFRTSWGLALKAIAAELSAVRLHCLRQWLRHRVHAVALGAGRSIRTVNDVVDPAVQREAAECLGLRDEIRLSRAAPRATAPALNSSPVFAKGMGRIAADIASGISRVFIHLRKRMKLRSRELRLGRQLLAKPIPAEKALSGFHSRSARLLIRIGNVETQLAGIRSQRASSRKAMTIDPRFLLGGLTALLIICGSAALSLLGQSGRQLQLTPREDRGIGVTETVAGRVVINVAATENQSNSPIGNVTEQQNASNIGATPSPLSDLTSPNTEGREFFKQCEAMETGADGQKDEVNAFQLCTKASNAGYIPAMTKLALMYRGGIGIKESSSDALLWFQKAKDAQRDFANAATATTFVAKKNTAPWLTARDQAILNAALPAGSESRRGFNDIKLDTSYDNIVSQVGNLSFQDGVGWVKGKDDQFFAFSGGQLVGYLKTYRDDNDGWIAKLKEKLGPAQGDDKVFKASQPRDQGSTTNIVIWYAYSDSLVRVNAFWGERGDVIQQSIDAEIYDRTWLQNLLGEDLPRRRNEIRWMASQVRAIDSGTALGKLEPYPGTSIAEQVNGYTFLVDGTILEPFQPKLFVNLKSKRDGIPMAVVDQGYKFGQFLDPISGLSETTNDSMVSLRVDLDSPPAVMMNRAFVPFRTRINFELAKEFMANDQGDYSQANYDTDLYPAFFWKFDNDWAIRVHTNDVIHLVKKPENAKHL